MLGWLYWIMPATVPNGPVAVCQGNVRREWRVGVIAERVELPHDLGGDVHLAAPAVVEHAPKRIAASVTPDVLRQVLQYDNSLGHGLDGDPALRLAADIAPLVDGAPDLVALDKPVLTAPDVKTAGAHGLHLA